MNNPIKDVILVYIFTILYFLQFILKIIILQITFSYRFSITIRFNSLNYIGLKVASFTWNRNILKYRK